MKYKLNIQTLSHLALQLGTSAEYLEYLINNINRQYRHKNIEKKNGNIRKILMPNKEIKVIQRHILTLLSNIKIHKYAHGWIKGHSTKTNTQPHCKNPAKLCLDLKDCFPNISSWRIRDIYQHRLGCSPIVSNFLTSLTTYNFALPQGLPTSGALVNIVMYNMDIELAEYAKIKFLKFTRYGDDITFSGKYITDNQCNYIKSIITSHGFKLNSEKEEYTTGNSAPIITGLNASETTPIVPRPC